MTESTSHEIRWRSKQGQLTVGWREGEGFGKSSGGEVVLDWLQVTINHKSMATCFLAWMIPGGCDWKEEKT